MSEEIQWVNLNRYDIEKILKKKQWSIIEEHLQQRTLVIYFSEDISKTMMNFIFPENNKKLSYSGYRLSYQDEIEYGRKALIFEERNDKNYDKKIAEKRIKSIQWKYLLNKIQQVECNTIEISKDDYDFHLTPLYDENKIKLSEMGFEFKQVFYTNELYKFYLEFININNELIK